MPSAAESKGTVPEAATDSKSPNPPPVDGALQLPTVGRLGYLTSVQTAALEALRLALLRGGIFDPRRHDDHMLLRFLRARQFDVARALAMLSDYEKWRISAKVDELCQTFKFDELPAVRAIYPQYYHGTDKLGRPIYIEQFKNFDAKKLEKVSTKERLALRLVVEYEKMVNLRMPACSLVVGKHIEQSCTILDLNGVSLWGFSSIVGFVQEITRIGQNYYPEVLGCMFIVNAPSLFSTLWIVVRKFLDEATQKKIHILPSSTSKAALLEKIEAANLPKSLGGTCECELRGGGLCCIETEPGPWCTETPEKIKEYLETDVERLAKWAEMNLASTATDASSSSLSSSSAAAAAATTTTTTTTTTTSIAFIPADTTTVGLPAVVAIDALQTSTGNGK